MKFLTRILTYFFEFADYYSIDLLNHKESFPEKQIINYEFVVISENMYEKLISFSYVRGERYREAVKKRLSSNQYYCFAFIEKSSGKIAYTRWLCVNNFYSDVFKETFVFNKNESLTLDSFTPVEYRGKGLHKEMNARMLNYLKNKTEITKVYMVIKRFFPYLHKVVMDLGYTKLRSTFYYKNGSTSLFIKQIVNKLIK